MGDGMGIEKSPNDANESNEFEILLLLVWCGLPIAAAGLQDGERGANLEESLDCSVYDKYPILNMASRDFVMFHGPVSGFRRLGQLNDTGEERRGPLEHLFWT